MRRSGKTLSYCPDCLDKQRRINELQEEARCLKARLRYQERTAKEGPFASSTPSSKIPVKPSSLPERELRPLVVARKVSFGSQSKKGAAAREILMSVLHTLGKRAPDPAAALRACLDQAAINPTADPYDLLLSKPPPRTRN